MEPLNFFDLLSQETFELCGQLPPQNPFDQNSAESSRSGNEVKAPSLEEQTVSTQNQNSQILNPAGPGLVYRLDRGQNTFCIRARKSDDLSKSKNLIFGSDEDNGQELDQLLNILKITNPTEIKQIQFFPTESVAQAEILVETLANRRFPYQEDMLCNLSDPGFSWWMDLSQDQFQIYFKSHGVERAERLIRLGPVGDPTIAVMRLNGAYPLLKELMPIADFFCSDKVFSLKCSQPDNPTFIALRNLFWQGQSANIFENVPLNPTTRTLSLYFKEVAFVRSFWMNIQKILATSF